MRRYLLLHPGCAWTDIPELPRAAAAVLAAGFAAHTIRVTETLVSGDGETTKLLVQLQDGLRVESVVMSYDTTEAASSVRSLAKGRGASEEDGDASKEGSGASEATSCASDEDETYWDASEAQGRAATTHARPPAHSSPPPKAGGHRRLTLCVSSQAGCSMKCTFCATGTLGLLGHLTAGEIVEQAVLARRLAPAGAAGPEPRAPAVRNASPLERPVSIRNVVFMGMGEPLDNYEAVRGAIRTLTSSETFALRRRAVTLSTVGVVPRLRQLAQDLPGVSLALSLHAPEQALRARLVPSARAFPLPRILEAVDAYAAASRQRVFVEYVLLGGVNDGEEQARQLGELLRGRDVVVNLIPWNPVLGKGMEWEAPREGAARSFQRTLREAYGLRATVRQEKGQDVAAACGQLSLESRRGFDGAPGVVLGRDVEDLAL
ncbi:hypothetical protein H632_c653p0 [Helicosporidium sp. ATCC 50920]|nr:hypothetical protein H632_c653p0 [Helicosporidium sp. ATCC 50920]|eukprot:KDD75500.1 hypothetical protein H632_c653p0 [Helicosporidium sp. ATCC 50920]